MDDATESLLAYFDAARDAPEGLWLGALAMVEQVVGRAREGRWGRWAATPQLELRRLRDDLEEALRLAELAVELQESYARRHYRIDDDLLAQARAAGASSRRDQTVPAELARRVNAEQRRREREGLPPFDDSPEWRREAVAAIRAGRPLRFSAPVAGDREEPPPPAA